MATKGTDGDREQSSIPSWLKSTGAFVGIMAALSGAVVGVYQVISSLKQFQLQIAKEERGTAEAKVKQAAEESSRTETEARAREELRKKDLELKHTEFLTEAEKRKSMELTVAREHDAQEAIENSKVAAEVRGNQREDEKQLSENVGAIFGTNSAAPLATLSRYAKPGGENLSTILTPLVAKLDDVASPTEVNIIFQLFNKSGPGALNAVLDSNRIAFEKYKRDIRDLARIEFAAEAKRRSEPGSPAVPDYEIRRGVSQRIASTYVGNSGIARLIDGIVFDVSMNFSSSTGVPDTGEWEFLVKHSKIQLDILSQSKRSLLRLLDPANHSLDLSGMDLTDIKFPNLSDTSINFRGACLIGADLSGLSLDRLSLLSILEADVGSYSRYNPSISGNDKVFLNSLFTAVRLSKEQQQTLATPTKKLD